MAATSPGSARPPPAPPDAGSTRDAREALARLGIDRFVLSVHQASFPASDDDLGHGAPASGRGLDFLRFVARLGFTGVCLGPAGITTPFNPSPYDATVFSRNPLAISFGPLAAEEWGRALDPDLLASAVAARPAGVERVHFSAAHAAVDRLLRAFHAAVRAHPERVPDLDARMRAFRETAPWLAEEARFEAIAAAVGHDDPARWPASPPSAADAAERFELAQLVAAEQHTTFRRAARALGLALYADAHIGLSHRDRHLRRALFFPGHAMGAPPSRTNPDGQPWGYPVLDPRQCGPGGAARRFVEQRFRALFDGHDGLRVDHPHGWICPWVYRTDAPDPLRAVQSGARMFESPDLADHPDLAPLARVRPDQIDREKPRHDDAWVTHLEPEQINSYSWAFDILVAEARSRGGGTGDLLVEVLSTCPRPLAAVLERHGLGQFRVTQKARVHVPDDVYRGDNAKPADWIMVGNHDTPPLAAVVADLLRTGEAERRAAYLASRLAPPGPERETMAARLRASAPDLAEAMLAELFLGPARHVLVFWVDLFGLTDLYNRPGVVSPDNWTMRIPSSPEEARSRAIAVGRAPSIRRALALALRARGLDRDERGAALAARLRAA